MKTTRNNLKDIMLLAWSFVRRNGFTMAEAMKQAWAISKLRTAMHKGIVKFLYTKIDGTTRTAWGTLAENLIGETKGTGRKPNETLVTYWDTEKEAFRSFKAANFVAMA